MQNMKKWVIDCPVSSEICMCTDNSEECQKNVYGGIKNKLGNNVVV